MVAVRMQWNRPSAFQRSYELRSGEKVVATLKFMKTFGSLAEGKAGNRTWTLKRRGFLSPAVGVREDGGEEEVASYKPNVFGGRGLVQLGTGERLALRSTSIWGTEWALTTETETPLIRFHNKGVIKHGADVDVEAMAKDREDLAMLLVLVWYVLVLHQEDTAVSAATG